MLDYDIIKTVDEDGTERVKLVPKEVSKETSKEEPQEAPKSKKTK